MSKFKALLDVLFNELDNREVNNLIWLNQKASNLFINLIPVISVDSDSKFLADYSSRLELL